jgi:hypothetical protein
VLKLDARTRTATLAGQYFHGADFDAQYMGSIQPLQGGNEFVGWGSAPYFSEYSPSGQVLLDAVFPGHDLSYRARLEPWVGLPLYPPAGAARRSRGKTMVYASWNGASSVASWKVLGATGSGRMTPVAWHGTSGFETAMTAPQGYSSFQLQALDSSHRVIGTSPTFNAS